MNKNELNLGAAIDKFLGDSNLRNSYNESFIINNWEEMMGKTIARYTSKLKIQEKKIYVYITSAPLRQELSFSKEKIKVILNQKFSETVIEEVIIC